MEGGRSYGGGVIGEAVDLLMIPTSGLKTLMMPWGS